MFDVSGFYHHIFPEHSPQVFNWIQIQDLVWPQQNACIGVNEPFFADLAVCFGSSSSWTFIFRSRLRASAECCKFSCRILMCWSCFMMSLIFTRSPVPLSEKQPQNIKLPPTCFTVGTVFLGMKAFFRPKKVHVPVVKKF